MLVCSCAREDMLIAICLQIEEENDDDHDLLTVHIDVEGRVYAHSQVKDYRCRGVELEQMNVFKFFMDTYEAYLSSESDADEDPSHSLDTSDDYHNRGTGDEDQLEAEEYSRGPRRGRRKNLRSRYLDSHPEAKLKQRIVRSKGHRIMVKMLGLLGRWFPRSDDAAVHEFYCACVLVLFKPWRDMATDLKDENESWSDAFSRFREQCAPWIIRALGGLQYYHECKSSADEQQGEVVPTDDFVETGTQSNTQDLDGDTEMVEDIGDEAQSEPTLLCNEDTLKALLASVTPRRELEHAALAIEAAKSARIFGEDLPRWNLGNSASIAHATEDDLERLKRWKIQLLTDVEKQDAVFQEPERDNSQSFGPNIHIPASVELLQHVDQSVANAEDEHDSGGSSIISESLEPASVKDLRPDQFRAFDIVRWHLDQTLGGAIDLPPLRMIMSGEGGTGKSKVIQTITREYERRGVRYLLVKAAYTGVAASLIDGKTCNIVAANPVGRSPKCQRKPGSNRPCSGDQNST